MGRVSVVECVCVCARVKRQEGSPSITSLEN